MRSNISQFLKAEALWDTIGVRTIHSEGSTNLMPVAPERIAKQSETDCWMRSVSFAALHRVLKLVSDAPKGLRASDMNRLIIEKEIILTRRDLKPSPTTLYRYRRTLLSLNAIKRDKQIFRVNTSEPTVCELLRHPVQMGNSITDSVREKFSDLVFRNRDCRSLFFEVFMSQMDNQFFSADDFRSDGIPVIWKCHRSGDSVEVSFSNLETREVKCYTTHSSVKAVLYGLRYWARDELRLIDEYALQRDQATIMYPLSKKKHSSNTDNSSIIETVNLILSLRNPDEWTFFSISDLIIQCCVNQKKPIAVLYNAIDWLHRQWPNRVVLIPTTRSLVTLTARSSQQEKLQLRRCYESKDGLLISHIRVHRSITAYSGKE